MNDKMFNRILTLVAVASIASFAATFLYWRAAEPAILMKVYAVAWLFAYIFVITLGFKGSVDAHKSNIRAFAVQWLMACAAGLVLVLVALAL